MSRRKPKGRYILKVLGLLSFIFATPTKATEATNCQTRLVAGPLGASIVNGQLQARLFSSRATRIELNVFSSARGEGAGAKYLLQKDPATQVWSLAVPVKDLPAQGFGQKAFYYGYRVWGPNWTYSADWKPGSEKGFVADVDSEGNRFNPNKMLLDPYAKEVSHDPSSSPDFLDTTDYHSGPRSRAIDTAMIAPKGVILLETVTPVASGPEHAFKDEIIYEVHVRGFTKNDPTVPENLRGTYAGAAFKAAYLKKLGVSAVEFLPVHEFQANPQPDRPSTQDVNYWGYMTLNFFSPERYYSSDKSAGGPTREFQNMVRAFHDAGIKVYLDVVYNHTGEGGISTPGPDVMPLLSWRGIDNAAYYQLGNDKTRYADHTGCGNNVNMLNVNTANMIIDSLRYWRETMGVDGFRFDLATVLGNVATGDNFRFDPNSDASPLQRVLKELGARPRQGGKGIDFIAEPWAIGNYELGNFPPGWAEWNGNYRDIFRRHLNLANDVTPGNLAMSFAGSDWHFNRDKRKPSESINFMTAHDGFTLRDLFAYNQKNNNQPWPYGPSDGGENNNYSWDQNGDARMQRQMARNAFAILMLSAGTPMINGGDEFYRTLRGNNNPYNLDSEANWLNWKDTEENAGFFAFTQRMIQFRREHASIRRADFFTDQDITWYTQDDVATANDMMNTQQRYLGFRNHSDRIPGESVRSIYVGYNGAPQKTTIRLPTPKPGMRWYLVTDTSAAMEESSNITRRGSEEPIEGDTYNMDSRSVVVFVEKM